MTVHVGTPQIDAAYLGSTELAAIYVGTTEVWAPAPAGWTGAISLLTSHTASASGAVQSITSASFTPPANSLLFVQHSHIATGHPTVPDVQLSNTAGLTFARYLTAVADFAGSNDMQGAAFVAPVGGSPTAMTVTVDPYTTTDTAYQSMAVYAVTAAAVAQAPVGRIVVDGSTTHTTNPLPVAPSAGNLVIAGFSTHSTGGTAAAVPAGFTTLVAQNVNYQMQAVFYSTTHTATTATCGDLGESIYVSASWIMELSGD